jgi:hypothetical protein
VRSGRYFLPGNGRRQCWERGRKSGIVDLPRRYSQLLLHIGAEFVEKMLAIKDKS